MKCFLNSSKWKKAIGQKGKERAMIQEQGWCAVREVFFSFNSRLVGGGPKIWLCISGAHSQEGKTFSYLIPCRKTLANCYSKQKQKRKQTNKKTLFLVLNWERNFSHRSSESKQKMQRAISSSTLMMILTVTTATHFTGPVLIMSVNGGSFPT